MSEQITIASIKAAVANLPKPASTPFGMEIVESPFIPEGFIGLRSGNSCGFITPEGKAFVWNTGDTLRWIGSRRQ